MESKCLEYLREARTAFSPSFAAKAAEHLEPAAAAIFRAVVADRYLFEPVDAPQVLKHFLAAKRVALEERQRVTLLYVWWEPTNAASHPVFAAHAEAAGKLAAAVPDPRVTMSCLPYRQLWSYWSEVGDASLRRHVDACASAMTSRWPPGARELNNPRGGASGSPRARRAGGTRRTQPTSIQDGEHP